LFKRPEQLRPLAGDPHGIRAQFAQFSAFRVSTLAWRNLPTLPSDKIMLSEYPISRIHE
jgi:hypothetical protein